MVSHDLWAWKQKIVIHGDWNPRAWSTDLTWDWLYSQHIIWIDILRTFGGSCGSLFTKAWKIYVSSNIVSHLDMCLYYFRHDVEISSQVRAAAPKAPSVFYATPTEIPKTQQFGVSLSWYVRLSRALINCRGQGFPPATMNIAGPSYYEKWTKLNL